MSTITELERAVQKLPPEELAKFREWFAEFDAAAWDRQIERDAAAGKLDALADDALADLRSGRCKELALCKRDESAEPTFRDSRLFPHRPQIHRQ